MNAVSRLSFLKSSSCAAVADSEVVDAVVRTVEYADIFDYPLTGEEIHRYLIGLALARDRVQMVLEDETALRGKLIRRGEFFVLPGREEIVRTRYRRAQLSDRFWTRAMRYGRLISSMPFVRMVAVTGELAMDNVREESDIDFFIVTEHQRLWLCRLLILAVVRAARRCGDVVCPNYLLSERTLILTERDLYTAHEVVQMIPISGLEIYARFRQQNRWVHEFLPNAVSTQRDLHARPRGRPVRAALESLLRTPVGAVIEGWEMQRKLQKFAGDAVKHTEASFSADWCKGHVHNHGKLILATYQARGCRKERIQP